MRYASCARTHTHTHIHTNKHTHTQRLLLSGTHPRVTHHLHHLYHLYYRHHLHHLGILCALLRLHPVALPLLRFPLCPLYLICFIIITPLFVLRSLLFCFSYSSTPTRLLLPQTSLSSKHRPNSYYSASLFHLFGTWVTFARGNVGA